jgi:selenophosphate synthase
LALKTATPPPLPNELDEKAEQRTDADELEKKLVVILTRPDGILKYNAPPAALLLLEAHDSEVVDAMQRINVLFEARALDDSTTAVVIDSLVSGRICGL